jgi:hypothetical protein
VGRLGTPCFAAGIGKRGSGCLIRLYTTLRVYGMDGRGNVGKYVCRKGGRIGSAGGCGWFEFMWP